MARAIDPEFSRPFTPEALAALDGAETRDSATEAECAALARRFAVPAVRALGFTATARPWGRDGWEIAGTAEARLEQRCVVTLEPVETTVSEGFSRRFLPAGAVARPRGGETEIDAALADGPDAFEGSIDLGEVAAEAVALGIDPYPRRAGAAFDGLSASPQGAEPLTDEAARPFAGLAALRHRRDGPGRDGSG